MSFSYYLAVFHYLSGEHYRLGQLSDASRQCGDFGKSLLSYADFSPSAPTLVTRICACRYLN